MNSECKEVNKFEQIIVSGLSRKLYCRNHSLFFLDYKILKHLIFCQRNIK